MTKANSNDMESFELELVPLPEGWATVVTRAVASAEVDMTAWPS